MSLNIIIPKKPEKTVRHPFDNAFQQQQLDVWKPVITFRCVILTYLVVALITLPLGIAFLVSSNKIVDVDVRYDHLADCRAALGNTSDSCNVEITIPEDMESPVYLYYHLSNYYQNHRRYVKSRDDNQLRGESGNSDDCDPLVKFGDAFGGNRNIDLRNKTLYPCGLIANTMFNDEFSSLCVSRDGGACLSLSLSQYTSSGIAYPSDIDEKFIPRSFNNKTTTNRSPLGFEMPKVDDEAFTVWMRVAGLPSFAKLNRIIHKDLKAGDVLQVSTVNLYDPDLFDGEKRIILSTSGWMGTKGPFLGAIFITTSCVSLVLAGAFLFRKKMLEKAGVVLDGQTYV